MAMMKRVFLFMVVNVLVLITISFTASLIMRLLGVNPYYMSSQGLNLTSLLVFCAVFGFTGAFISLALSRVMAKWMMGVKVIDPSAAYGAERDLVGMVHRMAQKAGLPAMPEVGIYESPEVNAFATGPSKSRALVAVSTGLLHSMDREAVEGVIGHEVAHIANGDMVTMTLIQGVVNTFVMFLARIFAWGASQALAGNRDSDEDRGVNPLMMHLFVFVFEIAFSLLGAIVVAWFSRRREFRADKGGAQFAGREKMVYALESLKRNFQVDDAQPAIASLKINGKPAGIAALFATHPDLDTRIAALRGAR